ncbi:MAG: putative membrane protein [Paracoccaceae bacterium]|jgi:putative membrane protein
MSDSAILKQPILVGRAKKLKVVVWILSIVVFGLVVAMRSPAKFTQSLEVEGYIKMLPGVVAIINTMVAACLLGGLWYIVQKKYKAHQRCMTAALLLSAAFLVCYVVYHFTITETKFGDIDGNQKIDPVESNEVGGLRFLYLTILLTHIVAAAVSFPMILMTFVHAWTRDFAKHKKLARKVFPLWLYVAVTGPIVYWMLKPYYLA